MAYPKRWSRRTTIILLSCAALALLNLALGGNQYSVGALPRLVRDAWDTMSWNVRSVRTYSLDEIRQILNLTDDAEEAVRWAERVNTTEDARVGGDVNVIGNVSALFGHGSKCPPVPPDLLGLMEMNTSDVSWETIIAENPEVEPGGRYKPKNCISRNRVAIIVPYRDREAHLRVFLRHLHPMLRRQQLEYGIYVIDQVGKRPFNRAMLFNVGFLVSKKLFDYECFVFHDVDLIPEDDRNLYSCPEEPRHMSIAINDQGYKLPYDNIFGGVSAMTREQFETVNGFSNKFWGWGGEDDEMYERLKNSGFRVSRYPMSIGRYTALQHAKAKPNPRRYHLLHAAKNRMSIDGLDTIRYDIVDVVLKKMYTSVSDLKMKGRLSPRRLLLEQVGGTWNSTPTTEELSISRFRAGRISAGMIRDENLKLGFQLMAPNGLTRTRHLSAKGDVHSILRRFAVSAPFVSAEEMEAPSADDRGLMEFYVDPAEFLKGTLETIHDRPEDFWKHNMKLDARPAGNLVVEFSSPNIAKPFHMGHLRSTLVGNYVANVCRAMGDVVTTMNFLGDWGTQFGLLSRGLEDEPGWKEELMKSDSPLSVLQRIYIYANSLADENKEFLQDALAKFKLLEEGNPTVVADWQLIRESQYQKLTVKDLVETWKTRDEVLEDDNGRVVAHLKNGKKVTLLKSDGASIYLSRDIAKHVNFGRILGMSTRRGTAVMLADILDEARDRMEAQQAISPNTRATDAETVETLGLSCLVINVLAQRRVRDYEFRWEQALASKGDSGVALQYCHARLCSLEEKCGVDVVDSLTNEHLQSLLRSPEAILLTADLARANINRAFKVLPVKGRSAFDAEARMMLFHCARMVLSSGLKILGVQPLAAM
ncbi:unnamed protein product [Notodromas monacha]|uniref:DALR anticodon binding domain-containing protein n=1 Tax=Notodromas monacha TaxID=399045 RepID=A0A7R9BG18_9CRUS|nr:unnamed protein product [Notodromas monacha]CAG0914612.1 unnamed protein product [Notodromas monacha]